MKTELTDLSATQKQLVFEIPADTVEAAVRRVTLDYTRSARLPGFRPGKAPAEVVRKKFKEQILHDVMHELIPHSLDQEMRERQLDPVDTPDIKDVSLTEGEPMKFTAVFETVPPFEPLDYASVQLRRELVTVEEQAVDSVLARIRERNARFEPVGERPSEAGDTLTLEVTRTQKTSPAGGPDDRIGKSETSHDVSAEIGASINPPGFDEHITGLVAGDRRTFTVRFPDDYGVEHLRGADVDYDVTVKAVRRKVLADLDDEFAKDLGLDSLAALRERVRDDLVKDGERTAKREMRDGLLRQLASRVTVEVPETLVAREVDRRLEEFVRRLVEQNVDPMKAGIDWEDFREKQRDSALETVKATLVLDDVARRESVQVPEEDVDAELRRFAEVSGRSVGQVRARLEREGGLARLVAGMQRERVVEFLMTRATILDL